MHILNKYQFQEVKYHICWVFTSIFLQCICLLIFLNVYYLPRVPGKVSTGIGIYYTLSYFLFPCLYRILPTPPQQQMY